jgi:AcrR family transcriptional regulator
MPKQVDHQERREQIASALMRVAASQGLEAVSLRHVAAEAGVTSGMVQHYFPSKDAMMAFAMRSASARYEARMNEAVAALGAGATGREVVGALLMALLPQDEAQQADARVALAFQAYAATRRAAADRLSSDDTELRTFIADQIREAQAASGTAVDVDPAHAATALLATAEGLGVQILSTDLSPRTAVAALQAQLCLTFGRPAAPLSRKRRRSS